MNRKSFSARLFRGKPIAALALAALAAGCSNMETMIPAFTGATTVKNGGNGAGGPVAEADKIKVLPLSEQDLDCPSIDIADGGATFRVGGPANEAVRYQFDISDLGRECVPQGGQFALKIGVSGQALVGPAGAPGKLSADLKIVVASGAEKKQVYEKAYKVTVDTNGGARGAFALVADPIMLPLTRTDLDNVFSVTVGFGNSAAIPKRRHS